MLATCTYPKRWLIRSPVSSAWITGASPADAYRGSLIALGLFATLALRELTDAGRITVIAKHGRQADLARAFGATDVASPDEAMASATPAPSLPAIA